MTLESALLPIPSEVTMPFAGYLAHLGAVNFWLIVFIGALGNLTGSLLSYAIGYFLEETVILTLIQKYGKYVLIREKEYHHAVHWFQKYGNPIAFFSRLLPAVRTFISLPAGLAEMNIWQFSLYTFAGSFLWSLVLTYVGFTLGKNWDAIHPYFQKFQFVVIGLVVLAIAYAIYTRIRKQK